MRAHSESLQMFINMTGQMQEQVFPHKGIVRQKIGAVRTQPLTLETASTHQGGRFVNLSEAEVKSLVAPIGIAKKLMGIIKQVLHCSHAQ